MSDRTADDVLASFPPGSVTALPAGDVAVLVREVERLRGKLTPMPSGEAIRFLATDTPRSYDLTGNPAIASLIRGYVDLSAPDSDDVYVMFGRAPFEGPPDWTRMMRVDREHPMTVRLTDDGSARYLTTYTREGEASLYISAAKRSPAA